MKKTISSSTNVLQNTAWLMFGSIARMIIQLIVGAISARYLGPTNYGVLNYANAYISLFSIICELGLTISIVNEIVKDEELEGICVGTAIVLRGVTSICSIMLLQVITHIVDAGDSMVHNVTLIRSIGLFFEAFYTISFWYHAKLRAKYTTIFELVAYALSAAYKVIILILGKNIYWFAAAATIDSIVIAIMFLVGYSKHSSRRLRFSFSMGKRLLITGIPFIFSGIMVYIYGQTDRIMIGKMLTQTDVGLYSCASSIGTMIGFIPQAIMNSGKTVIMTAKKESYLSYEKNMRYTMAAVLWTMNAYALFIILFGKYMILILFGEEYIASLSTLNILIWSYGLSYVGTLRNVWLICENKKHYATIFSTIGAITNVLMNLLFIPIFGIGGAAIATVITQMITTFVMPFVLRETRRFAQLLLQALFLRNIEIREILQLMLRRIKNEK